MNVMYSTQTETRIFQTWRPVGMELRTLRKKYALKIEEVVRQKAIDAIAAGLSPESLSLIQECGREDPDWLYNPSVFYYCDWLLEMRNALKSAGLNDAALGIEMGTLDDYSIGLVEMAVGLTDQSPLAASSENIDTGIVGR